ncbi:hypothetical protein FPOA_03964 [Fusarium poae]|uniref:Uncharacterized protein n=1 Tax=Fusarium poae TaxID=36050 RepID=A0A1B8ASS5_FUSPO|nr:hypothetical protein FPOA_03964 [Fusarium poae]
MTSENTQNNIASRDAIEEAIRSYLDTYPTAFQELNKFLEYRVRAIPGWPCEVISERTRVEWSDRAAQCSKQEERNDVSMGAGPSSGGDDDLDEAAGHRPREDDGADMSLVLQGSAGQGTVEDPVLLE